MISRKLEMKDTSQYTVTAPEGTECGLWVVCEQALHVEGAVDGWEHKAFDFGLTEMLGELIGA